MSKTKKCELCNKEFSYYPYREPKYCSPKCYLEKRWGSKKCKYCGKNSKYRFCSDRCRQDFWNKNGYRIYNKRERFLERKSQLIQRLGNKCIKCGISDVRVLDIHHKDKNKKMRFKQGYYNWLNRFKDWKKNFKYLELLCANCHRIKTWH